MPARGGDSGATGDWHFVMHPTNPSEHNTTEQEGIKSDFMICDFFDGPVHAELFSCRVSWIR